MSVQLAPEDIYKRMGVERTPEVKQLLFSVEQNDDGKPFIRVTTAAAIKESYVNFLVEVDWLKGRLLREFTIVVDQPVLLDEEAQPVVAPEIEQQKPE